MRRAVTRRADYCWCAWRAGWTKAAGPLPGGGIEWGEHPDAALLLRFFAFYDTSQHGAVHSHVPTILTNQNNERDSGRHRIIDHIEHLRFDVPSALTACLTDRTAVLFDPSYSGTDTLFRDPTGVFIVEHHSSLTTENDLAPLSIGGSGPPVGSHGPVSAPSMRDTRSDRTCRSRRTSPMSPRNSLRVARMSSRSSVRVVAMLERSARKNGIITPSRTAPTATMAIASALTVVPLFRPSPSASRTPRMSPLSPAPWVLGVVRMALAR